MKSLIPKLVGALINFIGVFNSAYASKLALQLFSKPRGGQLTPNGKLFLDTATKTTLYYNDLPIQTYQWKGSKETSPNNGSTISSTTRQLESNKNIEDLVDSCFGQSEPHSRKSSWCWF